MANREKRVQMGASAKKSMRQYAPNKIWDAWDRLIKEKGQ